MMKLPSRKVFINGVLQDALSDKSYTLINPSTEEPITQMAECAKADVDMAVKTAREALDSKWADLSPTDRGRILMRASDLLLSNLDEFAYLETINVGKPITATKGREISRAAEVLRYYAGWANKIQGETLPTARNYFAFTVKEPVGVVGAIVPWNFPLIIAMYKLAPALACGNTVILKPSEYSPLTALRFAELCTEAGLPEGVLNVITGGPEAGKLLVMHPLIDKIAFTGSVRAGQDIMRGCADTLKRVHLELGGKSPNIVFQDADLEQASQSAFNGIFYNAGQVCIAGSRLFVERKVHDRLIDMLLTRTKNMVVGDPLDERTTMGPVVSRSQYDKVMFYISEGKKEGAKLLTGANKPPLKGYYINPTLFDEVSNNMRIAQEEIFGPVLSVIPFDDFEQAIVQSNDTIYGLAAGVWTRDMKKALKAARLLKAGTVWINCFYIMDPVSPFGGYKKSGFGRDLGEIALDNYLQTKTIWTSLE